MLTAALFDAPDKTRSYDGGSTATRVRGQAESILSALGYATFEQGFVPQGLLPPGVVQTTLQRTNGGLERVMTPVTPGRDAAADVTAFATALLPRLQRLMP